MTNRAAKPSQQNTERRRAAMNTRRRLRNLEWVEGDEGTGFDGEAPRIRRRMLFSIVFTLHDGDVTIHRQIREALDQAAGPRPGDLEPVNLGL